MLILFLHGWQSTPGGLKPTCLKDHGHEVLNPALPDDDFQQAVAIAQAEFDAHKPDVVVGSSRGGAVAMNIDSGDTPLVLLCPAWKTWGTARTVKPGTVILHSEADDVVPFFDSAELLRNSGLPPESLVAVGTEHRLADEESLRKMVEMVEGSHHMEETIVNEVSHKAIKRIETLAQIAAELRQGRSFNVTRLTLVKSLCGNPDAAAKFAFHLAKLTLKKMKAKSCPSHIVVTEWKQYQRLAADAVRAMTRYMKEGTLEAAERLDDSLVLIQDAQDDFERQRWGRVRRIYSRDLLVIENTLECMLRPHVSEIVAYDLARRYCERYDARHGTGLIPESAPMVEDIAEFWGRHYLGRGWKKRLAKH